MDCYALSNIIIPSSVTSIGYRAFIDCSSLPSIEIPSSVKSIGVSAFAACSSLTSVEIPSGVTIIEDHTFSGCTTLETVSIPNSIISIGGYAFNGCTSLTSVDIPNSVKYIGGYAFWGCNDLKEITIGSGVIDIGESSYFYDNNGNYHSLNSDGKTFALCKNLEVVKCLAESVPSTNTNTFDESLVDYSILCVSEGSVDSYRNTSPWSNFGKIMSLTDDDYNESILIDDIYYILDDDTQTATVVSGEWAYSGTVIIPASVTSDGKTYTVNAIGESAFQNATGLTAIGIPSSVTSIGDNAFDGCNDLASVTVAWETPISINSTVFPNCNNNLLCVPVGSSSAYAAADNWNHFKEIMELEVDFNEYTLIKSITWGDGIDITMSDQLNITAWDTGNKIQQVLYAVTTPVDAAGWFGVQGVSNGSGKGWWNRSLKGLYCYQAQRSAAIYGDDLTTGWIVVFQCSGQVTSALTLTNGDGNPDGTFTYVKSEDGTAYYCTITAESNAYVGFCGIKNSGYIKRISIYKPKRTVVMTSYTVKYVDTDGNNLKKSVIYNSISGIKVSLSENDTSNIILGDDIYIFERTDADEKTVAMDGSTVVTIVFHKAQRYSYKVNEVANGTVVRTTEGFAYEMATVTVPYRKYNVLDGVLYSRDATNREFNYTFTLSQDKQEINIDYTATDITNVVYLSEGEDIEGLTLCTSPNTAIRSSNSSSAYAADGDVNFVTLGSGTYKLTAIIHDASKTPDSHWIFKAGENQIADLNCTTVNIQELASEEFTLTENTPIYIAQGGNGNMGIDLLYITDNHKAIFDGIYYSYNTDNNEASVIGLSKDLTEVKIPNSVILNGTSFIVKTIGEGAFWNATGLRSISIPSSVTSIGDNAFDGCNSLKSVTVAWGTPIVINSTVFPISGNATLRVPNGCESAYASADYWKEFKIIAEPIMFADNTVKALCLANWDTDGDGELYKDEAAMVTDLGSVFTENTDITTFDELQFFTGLTTIGERAFYYCSNLTSVTIPDNVTTIGNRAFYVCSSLTSLHLSARVTSVEDRAFAYCSGLEEIIVDDGNTVYDSRNDCNALIKTSNNTLLIGCKSTVIPSSVKVIAEGGFRGCAELKNIEIPEGVTTIATNAFRGCTGLESVTLPSTITSIGNYAFSAFDEVYNLTTVTVGMNTPVAITSEVFPNRANSTLYVPKGSRVAYKAANYWKEFKNIIEIGETVVITDISGMDNAFYMDEMTVVPGNQYVLPVKLKNNQLVMGYQFDLELPEGVSFALDGNGKVIATMSDRGSTFSISKNKRSDRVCRFVVIDASNNVLSGEDGVVMNITVDVANDMEAGAYGVVFKNGELTTKEDNAISSILLQNVTAPMNVVAALMGDVNNDGRVSVTDVVAIVGYILGNNFTNFVKVAADLNGDGSITVADVVKVINLILNDDSYSKANGLFEVEKE